MCDLLATAGFLVVHTALWVTCPVFVSWCVVCEHRGSWSPMNIQQCVTSYVMQAYHWLLQFLVYV